MKLEDTAVFSSLQTPLPSLVFLGSSTGSTRELSVLMGSEATLSCVFDRQSRPVEWSDLTVEWNLVDKQAGKRVVYTFEDGRAHVNRGGSVVNETRLCRSDASLQLFNVTVRDEGVYTCRIITPVVYTESTPSFLQISSIPQIPEVERLLVLCCRVENFYPQDVHLEWSRSDGEQVRTVTHFGPFPDHSSGLFSVWSKIQLLMAREDEKAVYTCRVYHSSFPTPGYKDVRYHINTQVPCSFTIATTMGYALPFSLFLLLLPCTASLRVTLMALNNRMPTLLQIDEPSNVPYPMAKRAIATDCHLVAPFCQTSVNVDH
uniref:Ig-like domain-containing protein n=1 Tax=Amphiprion percula TaxID=161767 RepID=A0A3P8TNU0_AMPPE